MTGPSITPPPRRLGPDIPKVQSANEFEEAELKKAEEAEKKGGKYIPDTGELPPVIRSIMEVSNQMMSGPSQWGRGCPGSQGGLQFEGKPYCFASGFRDSSRVMDLEEKGNHIRVKDPLVYGHLSIPVLTSMIAQLSDENIIHFDTPLSKCIPELNSAFDTVTPRDILSYGVVLNEKEILKDCHSSNPKTIALLRKNVCGSFQTNVYGPINKFFSVGSNAHLIQGKQQRENFASYICNSKRDCIRMPLIQSKLARTARPCHFGMALLVACVERCLGGVSFEDAIREKIFLPTESNAAGYGPPKVYRDPNDLFYKPSGQASGHQMYKLPVPVGAFANCAPSMFNASMNLYAPTEEFAKLLCLSSECIHQARTILGPQPCDTYHYDLGVIVDPTRSRYFLRHRGFTGLDFIPYASSFMYDQKNDVACYTIVNNGTRRARFYANVATRTMHSMFLKNVSSKGLNANQPLDPEKPNEFVNPAHEELEKQRLANYKSEQDGFSTKKEKNYQRY